MSQDIREHIDKIRNFTLNESVDSDKFDIIDKTIRAYIKAALKSKAQIIEFVPNYHIAEVFKDVLIHSELENDNPDMFYNVKEDPYDSIGKNNPDDYDRLEDGRYVKKKTYSVGINDILIPEYFDMKRLKEDGLGEVYWVYQKLREKKDEVRNKIMLARIVLPREFIDPSVAKSYKIKLK